LKKFLRLAAERGGYAIWLAADGIEVETVRGWQGIRHWSPKRGLADRD